MKKGLTLVLLGALLFLQMPLQGQQQSKLDQALRHFEQQLDGWELQAADITDMVVSDQYVSRHNGVTHFYFIQRYAGIPVYNAINGVHVMENGKLGFATNRFVADLANKINTTTPQIGAYNALQLVVADLDVRITRQLGLLEQQGNQYTFEKGNIANSDIKVKLMYQPLETTGEVRLAWDVTLDQSNTADYWSIRVDAVTGEILDQHNWTLYCSFDAEAGATTHHDACAHQQEQPSRSFQSVQQALQAQSMFVNDGGTYNVFPVPVESPIHGERELVENPADPVASPYGWHDTNGQAGPEYTITRGNNVHAYLDVNDMNGSAGDEPDGGEELFFDFYFDINDEPENMQEAAVTQLFYMNNMLHDILWHYGFDEASGNFQQRNYSGQGASGDQVRAEAQDGSGTNNANFATPPDGSSGRMQMYIWTGAGGRLLTILDPEQIAGGYDTGTADFGPSIDNDPVEGLVAEAFDGTSTPSLGCETIVNPDEVAGKVAMVDRGSCFFEEKTANVEAAGAIALIICNFEENAPGMAGVADIEDPNIPTVSLKASDCALIRTVLNQGTPVTARLVIPDASGPDNVDADFDNGIIAHEFGHGISNRLTGGPSAAGCLGNDEQMGEGWSDFFTLITSVRPDDTGDMPRGIGNYAVRNNINGGGIRRLPYSTDPVINDQVYDDVIGTGAPHPLGEVWAGVTWDLYWAFVDEYGFDEDMITGTGGNNIAIQLVMDGMKLQSCSPGFIDGRDAIIAADFINYDGIHECLIWEVFARRGFGWFADQGTSNNRNDGSQNFDPRPDCIKELKITKSADVDLIGAGEQVEITLIVTNHKDENVTDVTVNDELPTGMTYVAGSASGADVTDNGSSLTFTIGELAAGEDVTIQYIVNTDAELRSIRQFFDDIEDGDNNWFFEAPEGADIWQIVDDNPLNGNSSWFVQNTEADNDQILRTAFPLDVTGNRPVIRFWHDYNTEVGSDGGIVQLSTDGVNWFNIDNKFVRNGYRGQLAYGTFAIPNLQGYWGNSNGYIDSYIDLSEYIGQTVEIRFRFGSDDAGAAIGWYMDDFELMDMLAYNGEACVTSAEGDLACARLPRGGVIVDSDLINDVDDPIRNPEVLQVYPNPAKDVINIAMTGEIEGAVDVQLLSTNGVLVRTWRTDSMQGQVMPVAVSDLPAGFYIIQVNTQQGIFTEKVTIQ